MQQLPAEGYKDKSKQYITNLHDYHPNLVLMSDISLNWERIPVEDSWYEQTWNCLPHHIPKFSYNTHEYTGDMVQRGGTGILAFDEAISRKFENMGSDPDNLGRWTWIKIQGCHGHFMWVISAYRW